MRQVSQITADLGPAPDAFQRAVERLAAAGVGIRALARQGTHLRLLSNDPDRALGALGEAGVEAWLGDALSVEVENRPGTVERIVARLLEGGIDVPAAYTGAARASGRTLLVLTCSDVEKALDLLDRE